MMQGVRLTRLLPCRLVRLIEKPKMIAAIRANAASSLGLLHWLVHEARPLRVF